MLNNHPEHEILRSWDYHDLMFHRVHEILLVSSQYDGFILEEDGRLGEQILHEYLGINLRYAPRVWRASSAAEAMEMLEQRAFDLVVTMLRVPDMDPIDFGRAVKERHPMMPVILLAWDSTQLREIADSIPADAVDQAFIWTGNARVLMAIIKHIEDRRNADRDMELANVQAIMVVEDDPYYYSVLLPMLYSEIFLHTRNLFDESLNDTHRLLRMRARPKILLSTSFEEAVADFSRYHGNLLGIISDTRFPKEGVFHDQSGVDLARLVRESEPAMPFMLQSTSVKNAPVAQEAGALFLHKKSQTLLQDLREFITSNFGFGDFLFRLPDGTEIECATNLLGMEEALARIPEESLLYHAASNHFSNWCAARGELALAALLRPIQITDFDSPEEMRRHLIDMIHQARRALQKGRIVEFSPESYDPSATVISIGSGSLGGKARGLAFGSVMMDEAGLQGRFPEVAISIPNMAVIGTDEFDRFMDGNDLWEQALNAESNDDVRNRFVEADLSPGLEDSLRSYLEMVGRPISVRSSSLLEDSQFHSLAGMYSTFVLPNCATSFEERLAQLCKAVKLVYASTFHQAPKSFHSGSIHRPEEEKMAVIIQELAGQDYGKNRFYPTFSGVVQSVNYYPVSHQSREEGVAYVALGLGMQVVENRKSLRFSPKHPAILPQFFSPKAIMANSQNEFVALLPECESERMLQEGDDAFTGRFDLSTAEEDGALKWVGSVFDAQDGIIRDSLGHDGPRIVTFAPVLKLGAFPLSGILLELLQIGEKALGCPVEIEFAGNLYDGSEQPPEFFFLQIRPMAGRTFSGPQELITFDEKDCFCHSTQSLGSGLAEDIRDVVFVPPDTFNSSGTDAIAREIGRINSELGRDRPYLLIGPGRWGTADPHLGIPVEWDQISNARTIVEYNMERFPVEPSFGGHFFQNITSLRVGYLTISHNRKKDQVDWEWLQSQQVVSQSELVTWVRLDDPLLIQIDSGTGVGVCLKPLAAEPELMDERDSTGI